MKFSRRDFVHAGCAAGIFSLMPKANATLAMHAASSANNNRVTINVLHPLQSANLAKNINWNTFNQTYGVHPSIIDANGYPTSTPSVNIGANLDGAVGYFGDYVWSWTGEAAMQFSPAVLIRSTSSAGIIPGVAGTSGDIFGNMRMISQTNPRVQFTFGGFIQSISQGASNGAGGNYIRLTFKTGFASEFSGANNAPTQIIKIQNSAQNSTNVQVASAIDTWNWIPSVGDANSIDLTTSITTGLASVFTTTGGAGGEGITTPGNLTLTILAQGTFSGFTNLIWCTTANESAVLAGTQINDPTLRDQYKYLMNHASAPFAQRGWLRWMDLTGINQGSFESDFANRMPVTCMAYAQNEGGYFCPANITTSGSAAITWNAGDAYTCADASKSVISAGKYIDNSVIQGIFSAVNAGATPTLAVGTGPAAPLFDITPHPTYFAFTSAPTTPGTDILHLTFNVGSGATWLGGGSTYTMNYQTVSGPSGDAVLVRSDGTGLLANLKAAIAADATLSAALIRPQTFGNNLSPYPRTAQANGTAGVPIVLTYSGTAGCTIARITPGVTITGGTYTSGSSSSNLVLNFSTGPINWTFSDNQNSGVPIQLTGMAGTGAISSLNGSWQVQSFTSSSVTLTVTSGLGAITISGGTVGNSRTTIVASGGSCIYNQILGGWIYRPQGIAVSTPVEAIVELCNQVGAHCWDNLPVYSTGAYITARTQFIADGTTGLTQGLRYGNEVGNELWNFSLFSFSIAQACGYGMGFTDAGETPQWSWGGLRLLQYGALAKAAWTGKGRAAGDYYLLQIGRQSEAFASQNFENFGLLGSQLTTTNTVYATYGGLGGGAGADHSTGSPLWNRPVDIITASGFADYWDSDYIQAVSSLIFGSVSDNAIWLQAANDYANGRTTTAFSALVTMFNTARGTATIAAAGSSYNNSTGAVTLALVAPLIGGTLTVGDQIFVTVTGSGSIASINGFFTSTAGSNGTTVINYNAGAGHGSITITGGTVNDTAIINAQLAQNFNAYQTYFWPNFEAVLAQYDNGAGRATNGVNPVIGNLHYEGAPQWSFNNSGAGINGTNGVIATGADTSLTDLATKIGSSGLNWDVSAYTLSRTNNATEMAQMAVNMIQGWKLDLAGLSPTSAGTAANTGSYKNMIKTNYYQALKTASLPSGRENKGAQYGYQLNTWGVFAGNYQLGNQAGNRYASYDAIHEWNA